MSDPKRAVFDKTRFIESYHPGRSVGVVENIKTIIYTNRMALKTYIDETKGELRHVSWPSRAEAINYTILVVVVSVATAAYLSLFDGLFASILKALLSKFLY